MQGSFLKKISVVNPTGKTYILKSRLGKHSIIAYLDRSWRPIFNSEIKLAFLEKKNLFIYFREFTTFCLCFSLKRPTNKASVGNSGGNRVGSFGHSRFQDAGRKGTKVCQNYLLDFSEIIT